MQVLDISVVSWAVFLLVNGLVLTSSYCIASVLTRSTQYAATLAATVLIYLSQITMSVLLFGAVIQWLGAVPLGVFNALIAVGVMVIFWSRRQPFLRTCKEGLTALFREGGGWTTLLFVLLIVQITISLLKVAILPVHISDSLSYRAPPAVMWYQMGMIPSILEVPVNEMNGRSLGIAVLMLWFFVFLQDSLLVNIPQFISSIALIFIVYAMARQCGVSRQWAFSAATLCYCMPSVLIQSTATQDHLSINVAFLAALFFLREYFLRQDRSMILLMGISVGLMFGFKNNAVIYMPVLLGAGGYLFWKHRSKIMADGQNKRIAHYCLVALVLAFCIGGYWTTRNLIVFGDPFGMTFSGRGIDVTQQTMAAESGDPKAQKLTAQDSRVFERFLKAEKLKTNLSEFFPRTLDSQVNDYAGHMRLVSGFGPQFFTFGLPALVWLMISLFKKSWRIPGGFYATSGAILLLVYFCIMSNIFAYRNFIFFSVLMILFFFCIHHYFREKNRHFSRVVHFLTAFCVAWNIYVVAPPAWANLDTLKEFSSLERTYQTTGRYFRSFRTYPKILRQLNELPENEPIAYVNLAARNSWIYAFYDVHWQRKAVYIPLRDGLLDCNEVYCIPSDKFKALLVERGIALVNLCVSEACPRIKDPQFFEIGTGLYYFEEDRAL